jgi:thiol:disulfide interchange protein DsbC
MRKYLTPFVLLVAAGWAVSSVADDDAQIKASITERLAKVVPGLKVNEIRPAPVTGWYEVLMGAKLIYVSADAQYVFDGTLMDIKEQKNLTAKPALQARAAALKSLSDANKLIEFAPEGETRHVVYVFTDTDCAYCRKMHGEVGKLNQAGIAVRYIAYPRAGVPSATYNTLVSVWCATDRKQALTEAKLGNQLAAASCENPVKEEWELGNSMQVSGTPTTLLESGEELGGYIPAEQLIKFFEAGGGAS